MSIQKNKINLLNIGITLTFCGIIICCLGYIFYYLYFYPPTPLFSERIHKGTLQPIFVMHVFEDKKHNLLLIDEPRNIILLLSNSSRVINANETSEFSDFTYCSNIYTNRNGIRQKNKDGFIRVSTPSNSNLDKPSLLIFVDHSYIDIKNPRDNSECVRITPKNNSIYLVCNNNGEVLEYNAEATSASSIKAILKKTHARSFYDIISPAYPDILTDDSTLP